jgi:hypothetical protein
MWRDKQRCGGEETRCKIKEKKKRIKGDKRKGIEEEEMRNTKKKRE